MSNGGLVDPENYQGNTVGRWYRPSDEGPDTLPAFWEERHGSGSNPIPMSDSVTYDGWERLIAVKHRRIENVLETFAFDARGNVTIDASGAAFNVLDQLTSTAACASHSYDAAGNLMARTCGAVTWAYTYDALDRLTHVVSSPVK